MKSTLFQFIIVLSAAFIYACGPAGQSDEGEAESDSTATENAEGQEDGEEEAPLSPRQEASGDIGGTTVTIDYGAPSVRERTIWGDLEEWGKVWRAGANETTNIEFSTDVVLGDTPVAAGKYGFFLIPNEEGDWIAILNTQWSREDHGIWGAMGYSEENDVARVNVTPTWADESQEQLMYAVEDGSIKFAWEKARLSIPVEPAGAE